MTMSTLRRSSVAVVAIILITLVGCDAASVSPTTPPIPPIVPPTDGAPTATSLSIVEVTPGMSDEGTVELGRAVFANFKIDGDVAKTCAASVFFYEKKNGSLVSTANRSYVEIQVGSNRSVTESAKALDLDVVVKWVEGSCIEPDGTYHKIKGKKMNHVWKALAG